MTDVVNHVKTEEHGTVPEDLVSFVEAETANALNLPVEELFGNIRGDSELARIGLVRVTEALIHGGSVSRAVKEAGCLEVWLQRQLHRDDATGKVARWVTEQMMMRQWQSEHVLMRRFGHTCDTVEHHERRLRRLPKESAETFFNVYDEYLADAMSGYDQKITNINRQGV